MSENALAARMLAQEARSLLARLNRLRSLLVQETMVPAAAVSNAAQLQIEQFLARGRRELRGRVRRYLAWLESAAGRAATPAELHGRFTLLRLRFNTVLTHLDIFNEALSQRSEPETGVWLAGLDEAARDTLLLPGYLEPPALICYLARDMGGAIRRARARLPGGGETPVGIIRLPRERMVGSGVASSLVHEVGHQAADSLDLLPELRGNLARRSGGDASSPWLTWKRWISEIVADFWAIARVGITSTLGLVSLVSLPRAFVFRPNLDDPHPTPWLRVKLSCVIGDALYPHPQWRRLAELWESYYPLDGLTPQQVRTLRQLEASMPAFATLLLDHRPRSLGRRRLREVVPSPERHPERLLALWREWRQAPERLQSERPGLVLAVLGQARASNAITPERETSVLAELLKHWAIRKALLRVDECRLARRKTRTIHCTTLAI